MSEADPSRQVAPGVSCWRCRAKLRPGVRFCGHCGIALHPDDFLRPSNRQRERLGLGVALGTYFVVLASLIALLMAEVGSVRAVLAVDLGLLAFAVALLVVFWQEAGVLLGAPSRLTLPQIAIALGVLGGAFGLIQLLMVLFPLLFADLMQSYRAEGVGLGFAIFQVGPLTAFAEEILFRGVVLTGLRMTFPDRAAIAVSAAMFATIHLSPIGFIHTGVLGLLFGWLTIRTSSLWPAIILHTAWNTTMVLMSA